MRKDTLVELLRETINKYEECPLKEEIFCVLKGETGSPEWEDLELAEKINDLILSYTLSENIDYEGLIEDIIATCNDLTEETK